MSKERHKRKYPLKRSLLYLNQTEETTKLIRLMIPESSYLQMKSDMVIDGIEKVKDFLCELIRMYLAKDEDLLKCLDKIKDVITRQGTIKRRTFAKEYLKGKELMDKFQILNDEDKKKLFDFLEDELDE